jgi:hypothetical protein
MFKLAFSFFKNAKMEHTVIPVYSTAVTTAKEFVIELTGRVIIAVNFGRGIYVKRVT